MIKKEILDKLILRASKELKIHEVKTDNNYYSICLNYLKNQKFLNYKKLIKILKFSENNKYPIGYLMSNTDNKIVGFMGTFFSERFIENKQNTICNIHTWIVDKHFRLNAFFLIIPLMNANLNLTAFTPVQTLKGLLLKCGFSKKEFNYKIILNHKIFNIKNNQFYLEIDSEKIKNRLSQEDLINYKRYKDDQFYKILIIDKKSSNFTFIIASKLKKKGINILNFFHVSNKYFFKKEWDNFKHLLSKEYKVFLFSEYYFNKEESILLSNKLFFKTLKKNYYSNNNFKLNNLDILNSDLSI